MSKENSNYKSINRLLAEHFSFRVNSDGNVDNVGAVCCVHCHKSFVYHSSNTPFTLKITAFSVKPCRVF